MNLHRRHDLHRTHRDIDQPLRAASVKQLDPPGGGSWQFVKSRYRSPTIPSRPDLVPAKPRRQEQWRSSRSPSETILPQAPRGPERAIRQRRTRPTAAGIARWRTSFMPSLSRSDFVPIEPILLGPSRNPPISPGARLHDRRRPAPPHFRVGSRSAPPIRTLWTTPGAMSTARPCPGSIVWINPLPVTVIVPLSTRSSPGPGIVAYFVVSSDGVMVARDRTIEDPCSTRN